MKYIVVENVMCKVDPGGWGYILKEGVIIDSKKVSRKKGEYYILHQGELLQMSTKNFDGALKKCNPK